MRLERLLVGAERSPKLRRERPFRCVTPQLVAFDRETDIAPVRFGQQLLDATHSSLPSHARAREGWGARPARSRAAAATAAPTSVRPANVCGVSPLPPISIPTNATKAT